MTQYISMNITRENELDLLQKFVDHNDLFLTLTGFPGVGKSYLVKTFIENIDKKTYYFDFSKCRSESEALVTICDLFSSPPSKAHYTTASHHLSLLGSALLVFDNADHVISLLGRFFRDPILDSETKYIVTSCQALGIQGERILELGPLSLPTPEQGLGESESGRFFLKCVHVFAPLYQPDEGEKETLVRLLTEMDGLPERIQYAASLMNIMRVDGILSRILEFNRENFSAPLSSHLTHLWTSLDDEEKQVLAHLCTFKHSFDTASALELIFLWTAIEHEDALRILLSLRSKSLITQDSNTGHLLLYRTLRRMGMQELSKQDLLKSSQRTLGLYYGKKGARLAKENDRLGSQSILKALHRIHDGLKSALLYLREDDSTNELILARLGVARALGKLTSRQQLLAKGSNLLDAEKHYAASLLQSKDPDLLEAAALTLIICGYVYTNNSQLRLVEIYGLLKDLPLSLEMEARLTRVHTREAQVEKNWELAIQRSLYSQDTFKKADLLVFFASENITIGISYFQMGDYKQAKAYYELAIENLDRLKADHVVLTALYNLLLLNVMMNEHTLAKKVADRVIEGYQTSGNRLGIGNVTSCLALMHLHRDEYEESRTLFIQAISHIEASNNLIISAYSLCYLATLDVLQGNEKNALDRLKIAENRTLKFDAFGSRIRTSEVRMLIHQRRGDWKGVLLETQKTLDEKHINEFGIEKLKCLGLQGIALCKLRRLDEAKVVFDAFIEHSHNLPNTLRKEATLLLEIILSLEEESNWASIRQKIVEKLRGGFGKDSVFPPLSDGWIRESIRTIWPLLTHRQRYEIEAQVRDPNHEAICICPGFIYLRLPGCPWIDIGKHRNSKKLFETLALSHPLGLDEKSIIESLWPSEKIKPEAASNRVYNCVALLRRAGLKPFLFKTEEEGYHLDAAITLVMLSGPKNI